MPEEQITIKKDSTGRLSSVVLKKSHGREQKATYIYDSDGLLNNIALRGDDLPSIAELFALVDSKFTERIAVIDKQPAMEDLTRIEWLADGSYTERWEQGFRKILYHGRTGPYYQNESALNVPYKDWTIPEILPSVNSLEPAPWNSAIRVRNTKDGIIPTEMYVGFPKALKRGVFNFEAKLPTACKIGMYIGFEVNSGGQFAGLVALGCELADGQWRMKAANVPGGINGHNVTLNNPDVWDFYSLVLDPPYLYLYESPIGSAGTYPLTLLYKMDILNVVIKGIPFFCNEATVLSEFQMGNIWIYELPEGKHDFTHYYQAISGSAADGATVISNTAGKIIKIHRLFLQSTVDGATDVYLYEETSGTKVTTNTTLNAREGRESPFAQNPACIGQTAVANKKVLLKNAAAKQVNWEIIYSLEDG